MFDKEAYEFAYYSMEAGRYQQASDTFRFLTMAFPHMPIYWLGLAESSYRLKEEDAAHNALGVAKKLLEQQKNEDIPLDMLQNVYDSVQALIDGKHSERII